MDETQADEKDNLNKPNSTKTKRTVLFKETIQVIQIESYKSLNKINTYIVDEDDEAL